MRFDNRALCRPRVADPAVSLGPLVDGRVADTVLSRRCQMLAYAAQLARQIIDDLLPRNGQRGDLFGNILNPLVGLNLLASERL